MREEIKHTKTINNKGFSIIELIIVIAIMMILIGIVSTQLVPYIEKSKQAKDQEILSSMLTSAATAFASNPESYDSSSKISFMYELNVNPSCADAPKVLTEFQTLTGFHTLNDITKKMSSKAGKGISKVVITRDSSGVVTITTTSSVTGIFDELSSN